MRIRLTTSAFCAHLVELNLLDPLTATLTRPGSESRCVSGFLGVNEGRLAELPADTVLQWHRNGWLARACLHLFSPQRLQQLLQDSGAVLN
jgi:hypothetical protein